MRDVHYVEMLNSFSVQWLAVFPLNDFSECFDTFESSQTGPKVLSRPVQWLVANMSGRQGKEFQLLQLIIHKHVHSLLHAAVSTQQSR